MAWRQPCNPRPVQGVFWLAHQCPSGPLCVHSELCTRMCAHACAGRGDGGLGGASRVPEAGGSQSFLLPVSLCLPQSCMGIGSSGSCADDPWRHSQPTAAECVCMLQRNQWHPSCELPGVQELLQGPACRCQNPQRLVIPQQMPGQRMLWTLPRRVAEQFASALRPPPVAVSPPMDWSQLPPLAPSRSAQK